MFTLPFNLESAFKMKIIFYATNSSSYDYKSIERSRLPLVLEEWKELALLHSEHEFFLVTTLPSPFLTDSLPVQKDNNSALTLLPNLTLKISAPLSAQEFAAFLLCLKPDICIAATFWVAPFDWLTINDAMVASVLKEKGIKTFCHSAQTGFICFNKYDTHLFLKQNDFKVPQTVYVNHQQYWAERPHKELKQNVYKNYLFSLIEKMNYPVVIKDTAGLSSYSMEVAVSFKQAAAYLNSGRSSSDRIVEEFISGFQFGTEIYGSNGKYAVMPPFMFSVNKYGITSPKQCIKAGPVTSENFHLDELNETLFDLAKKMNFCGVAQVDLVFGKDGWQILEINPRLSGMTETYACCLSTTVPKLLYELAFDEFDFEEINSSKKMNFTMNLKLPLSDAQALRKMAALPFVKCIRQIHNAQARQEREKGYCELIFCAKSKMELEQNLEYLYKKFPDSTEESFLQTAKDLIQKAFD